MKSKFSKLIQSKEFLVFITSFIIIIFFQNNFITDLSASRIMTIQALVEQKTFAINDIKFFTTIDKIYHNGNFYSSKPPFVSIIGALAYFLYKIITGAEFGLSAYFIIKIFTVILPFSLLLTFFYKSLKWINIPEKIKFILTFSLGFATIIFPYSVILQNHTMSAFLIFLSFFCLLKYKFDYQKYYLLFLSGLFASLSVVTEFVQSSLILFIFFIYLLYGSVAECHFCQFPKNSAIKLKKSFSLTQLNFKIYFNFISQIYWKTHQKAHSTTDPYILKNKINIKWFILGCIPIAILYIIYNIYTTGSFLPPYANFDSLYGYENSYWQSPTGIDAFNHPKALYFFNILFGTHGLFIYSPLLIFGFFGLYKIIKTKQDKLRDIALMTASSIVLVIIIIGFFTYNYGGTTLGMRWFIIIYPLIMFFAAPIITKIKKPISTIFLSTLIIYSILLNYFGMHHKWQLTKFNINGIEMASPIFDVFRTNF